MVLSMVKTKNLVYVFTDLLKFGCHNQCLVFGNQYSVFKTDN